MLGWWQTTANDFDARLAVLALEALILSGCLTLWIRFLWRASEGQPILPFEPRRPVPWTILGLLIVVLTFAIAIELFGAMYLDLSNVSDHAEYGRARLRNEGAETAPLITTDQLLVFNLAELAALLGPLLSDPVRQVRIDAGRRLASLPDSVFVGPPLAARSRAMDEYMAAQLLDADRAEARLNLGALYAEQGQLEASEREYLAALRCSPRFPAAYVNLADLYRQWNREGDAVRVLREGMSKAAENADIPFALGLAMVRGRQLSDAIPLFERASKLAPESVRYAYVYAVALETAGPPGSGIDELKRAHQRRPNDIEVLGALVEYCRGAGRLEEAKGFADLLATLRQESLAPRRER